MRISPGACSPPAPARAGHGPPCPRNLPGCRSSVLPPGKGDAVDKRPASPKSCAGLLRARCGESPLPAGAGAGHRSRPSPPPRGSPRPPSPPTCLSPALFPGAPCSALLRACFPGGSPAGAGLTEADPLLAPGAAGARLTRLSAPTEALQSFCLPRPSSSSSPPPTPNPGRLSCLSVGSRREPRGRPAPLPPACLPARSASLPASPACSAGQRRNCEACRLPDGRGPGLVGPGGRAGRSPGLRRLPSRSRRARFGQRERRSRCQRRKGELGREQSCRERGRGST